jgi:hypothetical protein
MPAFNYRRSPKIVSFGSMEKNNQAILDMIAKYKVHLREHGLTDELYKWELIHF